MDKPLKEWTFEEIVRYSQGRIILAIPTGDFNDAVWAACDLALRWRVEKAKQEKLN